VSGPFLRIHRILPASRANGPGLRAVLWLQGCSIGCPGCFNPGTHDPAGGEAIPVDEVGARLASRAAPIDGLTVTGGEPLDQADALGALLGRLRRERDLSVILFTGMTWDAARTAPGAAAVLAAVDVVLAGSYVPTAPRTGDLRGTAAKTVHFLTDRHGPADLRTAPAEVIIGPDGEIAVTGIDPPRLLPRCDERSGSGTRSSART
jgi:anaerobic ribonucleoside-triphosphate reductase activating protein